MRPRSLASTQRLSGAASHLLRRNAVDRHDAAAQHRRIGELGVGLHRFRRVAEGGEVVGVDVEEVIGRSVGLNTVLELRHQRAVDQGDGDEEAEAEPERDRDLPGDRARAGDARQRERQGRWLGAPEARGKLLQQPAEAEQQEKAADDAGGDRERDGALLGRSDGESEEREPARRRGDDEGKRRPLLLVGEMRAHQHRRRHDAGAAQRQKHEEQHGEEPRACRGEKRHGMRLDRERDGQRLAIGGGEQRRGQRAKNEADDDAEAGEHERLDQIDGEHEPARGAERLEGGDHAALLRHVAADGVADADAAKQQRGQAHEADELGEALAPRAGSRARDRSNR